MEQLCLNNGLHHLNYSWKMMLGVTKSFLLQKSPASLILLWQPHMGWYPQMLGGDIKEAEPWFINSLASPLLEEWPKGYFNKI